MAADLVQVLDFDTLPIEPRCFVAGQCWIHFHAHPTLWGVILLGRPDGQETAALVKSLTAELGERVTPHGSLVDCSQLEGADSSAFDSLSAYVQREHARLARSVTRLALVRPRGMHGATIAGFFGVTPPPYTVSVFEDRRAALEWTGETTNEASAWCATLDRCVASLTDQGPLIGALRAALRERLRDPDLGGLDLEPISRALGVSDRTLQRRLKELETTFQREVTQARLAEVTRRLLDTDDPLTAIALDLDFASPQHLSALFKKEVGETPSAWRKRRRGS